MVWQVFVNVGMISLANGVNLGEVRILLYIYIWDVFGNLIMSSIRGVVLGQGLAVVRWVCSAMVNGGI